MSVTPEPGISHALAVERARQIADVAIAVHLRLPSTREQPVRGVPRLTFTSHGGAQPLVVDFAPGPDGSVTSVRANGASVPVRLECGHIVVDGDAIVEGRNTIEVAFTAGNGPLNRRDDLVYTIFVPARAHEAMPCFDQPNIKARWTLTLEIPQDWRAVSNTRQVGCRTVHADSGAFQEVTFAETAPLPSYLFAFAAGRLVEDRLERHGRRFGVYHTGVDAALVTANLSRIVEAHAEALEWMEDYTAIAYPFDSFDIVLIPDFQFGGMEHPGAIFYNAAALLLPESATRQQWLGRAHVIAHETAHIWFGDLVTMTWFDDVWMKEVFANFMAARITSPQFPDLDHDLRFLHAHYPGAYDVDRTAGTHPIRQLLPNLSEAGSLYGAIIYLKSPIVLRQLELIVGMDGLRDALRRYLARFAFGNASWSDLVAILADVTAPVDLREWARTWVDTAGRPQVRVDLVTEGGRVAGYRLVDPSDSDGPGRGRAGQYLDLTVGTGGAVTHLRVWHDAATQVSALEGRTAPDFVLPNGRGLGYGEFSLDPHSREWLLAHLPEIADPLTRGSAWLTLWDTMLGGDVRPERLLDLAIAAVIREQDELNLQRLLTCIEKLFWVFTDARAEPARAAAVEQALRTAMGRLAPTTAKAAVFGTLRAVAMTADTVGWLRDLWEGDAHILNLPLGEAEQVALVQELAVRGAADAETVAWQVARTAGRHRRDTLAFVAPALSGDPSERQHFFETLRTPANRRPEPRVIEGLRWLHHPLREREALRLIEPGLELLLDVKQTADIFLPKRWLDATLGGHRLPEAAATVRRFVAGRPADYPAALTRMVLASADPLFRAAAYRRVDR